MPRTIPGSVQTSKARDAWIEQAAVRALDDPAKLARAARIVRVALERQRLSLDDIRPSSGPEAA